MTFFHWFREVLGVGERTTFWCPQCPRKVTNALIVKLSVPIPGPDRPYTHYCVCPLCNHPYLFIGLQDQGIEPVSNPDCPATYSNPSLGWGGVRCQEQLGHTGAHRYGTLRWIGLHVKVKEL